MSILKINKFLFLENIEYKSKKFNVIIGKQASGKSLIVKLDYFFKEIIFKKTLISILRKETKSEFEENIKNTFELYFPKYTWEKEEINIEFKKENYLISITKTKRMKNIKLTLNKAILTFKNNLKKELKDNPIDNLINFHKQYNIPKIIFIPAVRSFLANIEKTFFQLTLEKTNLDPFLVILGTHYEQIKNKLHISTNENIKKLMLEILDGEYIFKNDESWIQKNNKLTKVIHSSSGQQEALPMINLISYYAHTQNNLFYVEEPEAHLFPKSQKNIIELLAIFYKNNNNISITTHSPYILSSINNLIILNEAIKKGYKKELEYKSIDINDVSAYILENNQLKNIIEDNLIDASKIDNISNEINEEFDEYMNLIYGF